MSDCHVLQAVTFGLDDRKQLLRTQEVKPFDKNYRSERIIPRTEQAGTVDR